MRLSFRTRLLAALLGLLIPILALILISLDHATDRQVESFTASSIERSREAFNEAENRNREVLTSIGLRFAGSPRTAALIHARHDPDTAFAVQQLSYDLELAGSGQAAGLVALTDIEGTPIVGVLDARAIPDVALAVPTQLLDSLLVGPDTTVFGYKLIDDKLYSVYMSLVRSVDVPIGFVLVGQPIDADLAEDLGRAVEGEVCFVAEGRCVAATSSLERNGLRVEDMIAATQSRTHILTRDGKRWLVIPHTLAGGAGYRVIARPLDALLQPFDDIKKALVRVGLLALLLALLFAVLLARGLARPVRALVAATSRVARGDYSTHIPVTSNDELGTLSRAFNEMTQGLLLKEQYRGLLDKVVSPEIAAEMLKSGIALGGENREVTILFADIRGFTPFTEGMEPQQVIALLNETMERASAVVEREGGVVDKYIGDEIMALFGAPISHGDDAGRAVRAAVGIRAAIQELARERAQRGDAELAIGIGVNTGTVVAGNMGSEKRLNYTVLGEAVNIAARLCSAARPHEILISEATFRLAGDGIMAQPAGERTLKGMTQPLRTYLVEGTAVGALRSIALVIAAATLLLPSAAHAQRTPFASWSNSTGSLQASLGARADATLYVPQSAQPWLIRETDPFIAPRVSVYGEGFAGRRMYSLVEVRADRGEAPSAGGMQLRVEQLFARYTTGPALELQAGKFVSPFGSYPQRHGTAADPLIRAPLPYEWPTLVTATIIPASTDAFLNWRDNPARFRPLGAPPVWGVPYQVGAMMFGTARNASYRVAVMNSAPSSVPREWDRVHELWEHPSFVGALAWQATPALRAGASISHGPFMRAVSDEGALPAGKGRSDYPQTLVGVEAAYARDLVEVRGEFFVDRWKVPNVNGTPTDLSGYVESRMRVHAGAFLAARVAHMRFNQLEREIAGAEAKTVWDWPVTRIQAGGGYQITSSLSVRAEYQWTIMNKPRELDDNLFSLQLRIDP